MLRASPLGRANSARPSRHGWLKSDAPALGDLRDREALDLARLAVILLIEGVWWPAAIVGLGVVMSWWRGRHDGAYLPATIASWHENHRR